MKAQEILKGMTLEEKIYHLVQMTTMTYLKTDGTNIVTGPNSKMKLDKEYIYDVGTLLNLVGAQTMIDAQTNFLNHSKRKIPPVFMQDVIHGHRTLYPINLGIAASFDTELAHDVAAMAAKEASLDGVGVTFAPMVDLVRDPRWGRVMESSGEDPYLNSQMAAATVKGYQGDMGKYNIAACVKHFAAYGAAEAGRDYNTVDISERQLREYYLPAYKAAVDAGVKMLMTSFNIVDGKPASGNKWLVNDVLRKEWGFEGVVISDYSAFEEMIDHGYCEDHKECAYRAMEATSDIEMMSPCYANHLKELVEEGKVTVEQIDQAVLRVLKLKEELGVFENPYRSVNVEEAAKVQVGPEHRAIARYAAEQSAVLLKNEGILPFSKDIKSVAVIGPNADTGAIHGGWPCGGKISETITVLEGVKNIVGDRAFYAMGCDIDYTSTDESKIDEAVELAAKCDAVILCLGEHQDYSGEGNSRTNIELPAVQYKLLDKILEANKNTAVALFTGRPLAIWELDKKAPAILNMWMPGTEGGNACANLIFGNAVPSGKITMTFPRVLGQVPIYYNAYNTGRPKLPEDDFNRVRFTSSYLDMPNSPLYPFGYGLSYTEFEYSDFNLSADTMKRGDTLVASVKVKNVGKYKAKESVQLYIRDLVGSVVRPLKELKGFQKIELDVGEEKTVKFEITEETLKYWNKEIKFVAENGKFDVFIGKSSACEPFARFELV